MPCSLLVEHNLQQFLRSNSLLVVVVGRPLRDKNAQPDPWLIKRFLSQYFRYIVAWYILYIRHLEDTDR